MKGLLTVLIFILFISSGCETVPGQPVLLPEVNTLEVTDISYNSAVAGVLNVDDGTTSIFRSGLCWGKSSLPRIEDDEFEEGGVLTEYTIEMRNLEEETEYFVRAFAESNSGISYGDQLSFTTEKFELNLPCNPQMNAVTAFAGTYTDVLTGIGGPLGLGDYRLRASSQVSSISIEFFQAPQSGEYITTNSTLMQDGLVAISITNNFFFRAGSGQTVYVEKLGEDRYSVNFCDMEFGGYLEFTATGNLTSM